MKEKKIRITLPDYIFRVIQSDENDFGLSKNKLCNLIFSLYYEKAHLIESIFRTQYNRILQFNLNVANIDLYEDLSSRFSVSNTSDYFRKIFYLYSDQPKYKREMVIFQTASQMIQKAITRKKKLKIRYKDEYRIIEPYFLMHSDGESRNYVFCYCYKYNQVRNYRLINIRPVSVLEDDFKNADNGYIELIKNNFDPFLSYGKTVKVRLTNEGIKQYKKVVTNRPQIIEEKDNIITFQCSNDKAKLYFPQFLDEAEILEPNDLREWFAKKFQKVLNQYNSKEN